MERFPEARPRYFAEQIDRDFPLDELDAYISERVADLEGQIEDQWDERRGAQTDLEQVEAEQERRRARRAGRDAIDLGADAARSIVPVEPLPVDPETGRPVINLPLGE